MIIRRRCTKCLSFFEVDEEKDKNAICPKCRSTFGRAKQKSIQKSAKKKARKAARPAATAAHMKEVTA